MNTILKRNRIGLIDGPPGTGKTTFAQWAAERCGRPSAVAAMPENPAPNDFLRVSIVAVTGHNPSGHNKTEMEAELVAALADWQGLLILDEIQNVGLRGLDRGSLHPRHRLARGSRCCSSAGAPGKTVRENEPLSDPHPAAPVLQTPRRRGPVHHRPRHRRTAHRRLRQRHPLCRRPVRQGHPASLGRPHRNAAGLGSRRGQPGRPDDAIISITEGENEAPHDSTSPTTKPHADSHSKPSWTPWTCPPPSESWRRPTRNPATRSQVRSAAASAR